MRLVNYERDGQERPGVIVNDGGDILDIQSVMPSITSLNDLIDAGHEALGQLAGHLGQSKDKGAVIPAAKARLLAPLARPHRNIFCVGKNYHEHAKEFHHSGFDASAGKDAIPEHPIFFSKSITTVIGPNEPIPASADWTNSVDYEAELAVVIGRGGRNITKNDAYEHVFGYMIVNDVTSRTLQQKHKQWFVGKNLDGFCPMGPWLVTADEVGNVEKLQVTAWVNGELRQRALVRDLIFNIPTLVETLSRAMTLKSGDIIATGTPAGVGIGFDPPKFLKPGDRVTISITKLGTLENPVA
jgi:2-keto-4-pentenoate hydratase/2-oxohepta-3-ene-1,7-dioic acid hydratase in catechol pathway